MCYRFVKWVVGLHGTVCIMVHNRRLFASVVIENPYFLFAIITANKQIFIEKRCKFTKAASFVVLQHYKDGSRFAGVQGGLSWSIIFGWTPVLQSRTHTFYLLLWEQINNVLTGSDKDWRKQRPSMNYSIIKTASSNLLTHLQICMCCMML